MRWNVYSLKEIANYGIRQKVYSLRENICDICATWTEYETVENNITSKAKDIKSRHCDVLGILPDI